MKLAAAGRRHAARRVGATMGRPAFITSTVFDILGSPPRSFRQWVDDHAAALMEDPASDEV